ncbi:MAG TPA: hypothetical protein VF618_28285 [Thermoanaerobaculia bacterium]
MLTIFAALAFLLLGREVAARVWRRGELAPLERACATLTFGVTLWLASIWGLALCGWLTRTGILILAVEVFALALWNIFRSGEASAPPVARGAAPPQSRVPLLLLAFLPVLLWVAFILWRGWIVPPLSHDALAYHLPKAVLYAREHGYAYFEFLDWRIRKLPASYELMLAEIIVLEGTDTITEWLSLLFYAMLVVTSGALVQRWWKRDAFAAAATMLFVAGIPVLLLHSGAHKNDVMTAAFMLAMLVWGGRWIATGDARALVPLILATGAAVGTKPQAGVLALALLPFALWRVFRERMPPRRIAVLALFGIAVFLLLGGWAYLDNYRHPAAAGATESVAYGDWVNLWEGPYVLLAAPFSPSPNALPVPWEAEPWFWRRYEIYFSHLGAPFSLAALLLPVALVAFRRFDGSRMERLALLAVTLVVFAIMLPVRFTPHGLYAISLPRYALFLAPVFFAWTIAPIVIAARERRPQFGAVVVALAAAGFVIHALDMARSDVFVPLDYVRWARERPGTRVVAFDPYRAAEVFDRAAGPRDRVAIDAGFGTWLQPLFGAELQRPVDFIGSDGKIPAAAQWVVVDRAWGSIWGHPDFKDLSQARQYLAAGQPYPGDTRLADALRNDARWEVVFYNPRQNQAVFKRR